MSRGVRLGFTLPAAEAADLESLAESEYRGHSYIALWAFKIGFEQIQRAGFSEARDQYRRRKDPTRSRMPTEDEPGPSPAPAECGRLMLFRGRPPSP